MTLEWEGTLDDLPADHPLRKNPILVTHDVSLMATMAMAVWGHHGTVPEAPNQDELVPMVMLLLSGIEADAPQLGQKARRRMHPERSYTVALPLQAIPVLAGALLDVEQEVTERLNKRREG